VIEAKPAFLLPRAVAIPASLRQQRPNIPRKIDWLRSGQGIRQRRGEQPGGNENANMGKRNPTAKKPRYHTNHGSVKARKQIAKQIAEAIEFPRDRAGVRAIANVTPAENQVCYNAAE